MHNEDHDPRDLLEDRGVVIKDSKSAATSQLNMLSELEKLPILLVRCSFNNTYVNIQDHTGRLLTWISAVSDAFVSEL